MADKRLTAKQAIFVREYLVDLNAAAAAVRAGYSERRSRQIGYELLQREHVAAGIREALDRRAQELDDSAAAVLRDLLDLYRRALGDGDYRAAVKALELRGKHLGMWKERVQHEGPSGGPVELVLKWQGAEADEDLAQLQRRWSEDEEA